MVFNINPRYPTFLCRVTRTVDLFGKKMLLFILNACLYMIDSPFRCRTDIDFNFRPVHNDIFNFMAKLPPWPKHMVTVENSKLTGEGRDFQTFYRFTGDRLGGNAAVIGNNCFPTMPECVEPLPLPFSKLLPNRKNPTQPIMAMSRVAYFEVTIHEPEPPSATQTQQERNGMSPSCIAVGIASSRFPLTGRMPGWDIYSFGYHGDDGYMYHDHMESENFDLGKTFGPHDIIGCGLIFLLNMDKVATFSSL